MVWLLATGGALAQVTVLDPNPCGLPSALFEEELRSVVGDRPVDELRFVVDLTSPDGVALTLRLTVADDRRPLWDRQIDLEMVDCPLVTNTAVLSFQAALATLPGWGLPPRPPVTDEIGLEVFLTLPGAVRAGAAGDWVVGITRAFRWQVQLEGQFSAVQQVVPFGAVQIASLTAQTGPALQLRVSDRGAIRWSNRAATGAAVTVGHALDDSETRGIGRAMYVTELGWVQGNVRVSARGELLVPARFAVVDRDGFLHYYREPPLRLGLSFEVARSIRPGDVGPDRRP